jgi:hypothetical protein
MGGTLKTQRQPRRRPITGHIIRLPFMVRNIVEPPSAGRFVRRDP